MFKILLILITIPRSSDAVGCAVATFDFRTKNHKCTDVLCGDDKINTLRTLYLLNPPSPYLLKTPVSQTSLIIPPRLVRPPYRAITAGTAIKHPHSAEPWMPSSCHRVPGTGNSLPYPRAPFVHPS